MLINNLNHKVHIIKIQIKLQEIIIQKLKVLVISVVEK